MINNIFESMFHSIFNKDTIVEIIKGLVGIILIILTYRLTKKPAMNGGFTELLKTVMGIKDDFVAFSETINKIKTDVEVMKEKMKNHKDRIDGIEEDIKEIEEK